MKWLCALTFLFLAFSTSSGTHDLRLLGLHEFSGSRLKACGGAGIASRGDIGAAIVNPALHFNAAGNFRGTLLAANYGRDSLFNRNIIPFFIAQVKADQVLSMSYRYMNGDEGITHQTWGISFSGKLFDEAAIQGQVDAGITIRGEFTSDHRNITQTLYSYRYLFLTNGNQIPTDNRDSSTARYNSRSMFRRIVADVGFYQPDIMERLDFGLLIRNLAGYESNRIRPHISIQDSSLKDTITSTDTASLVNRSMRVSDSDTWDKSWFDNRYRTVTIGTMYRITAGSHSLYLPADLEVFGLFDKRLKNHFVFRGGAELQLDNGITLRIGYARKPKNLIEGFSSFKNSSILSGGAGINADPIHFDCYFSEGEFGVSTHFGL